MSIVTTDTVGKRICDVLGVDANKTTGLSLDFQVGNIVTVTTEQLISPAQFDQIEKIISEYYLVRVERGSPATVDIPVEPRW